MGEKIFEIPTNSVKPKSNKAEKRRGDNMSCKKP